MHTHMHARAALTDGDVHGANVTGGPAHVHHLVREGDSSGAVIRGLELIVAADGREQAGAGPRHDDDVVDRVQLDVGHALQQRGVGDGERRVLGGVELQGVARQHGRIVDGDCGW